MKPKDWTPRNRLEARYRIEIDRLITKYLSIPEDATLGQINAILVQFAQASRFLESSATQISVRMATQIKVENAKSWMEAARKGSRGREIYSAIQREMRTGVGRTVHEIVIENAKLIRSLPAKISENVSRETSEMQQKGLRAEEIAQYLRRRIPRLTKSHAALIARTETSKSATALTRARSEDLGIGWYEWATSEDARVRVSHRKMDMVLVSWEDPPSPERLVGEKSEGLYHAGNIYNCRCDSYPVLRPEMLSWPHRVYRHGRIAYMTLAQFRKIYQSAIAA